MIFVRSEMEEVAFCGGIILQEKLQARSVFASYAIRVLEFERMDSLGAVQNKINFVLGPSAPIVDAVFEVVVVVQCTNLLIKERLDTCTRCKLWMIKGAFGAYGVEHSTIEEEKLRMSDQAPLRSFAEYRQPNSQEEVFQNGKVILNHLD